jgi:hypothetical protein
MKWILAFAILATGEDCLSSLKMLEEESSKLAITVDAKKKELEEQNAALYRAKNKCSSKRSVLNVLTYDSISRWVTGLYRMQKVFVKIMVESEQTKKTWDTIEKTDYTKMAKDMCSSVYKAIVSIIQPPYRVYLEPHVNTARLLYTVHASAHVATGYKHAGASWQFVKKQAQGFGDWAQKKAVNVLWYPISVDSSFPLPDILIDWILLLTLGSAILYFSATFSFKAVVIAYRIVSALFRWSFAPAFWVFGRAFSTKSAVQESAQASPRKSGGKKKGK